MPNDIQSIPGPGIELDAMLAKELGWSYSTLEEYAHLQLSTTWDGMRKVVEAMAKRTNYFCVCTDRDGGYIADFIEGSYNFEKAETVPHAVTLAAISACRAIKAIRGGGKSMP